MTSQVSKRQERRHVGSCPSERSLTPPLINFVHDNVFSMYKQLTTLVNNKNITSSSCLDNSLEESSGPAAILNDQRVH